MMMGQLIIQKNYLLIKYVYNKKKEEEYCFFSRNDYSSSVNKLLRK